MNNATENPEGDAFFPPVPCSLFPVPSSPRVSIIMPTYNGRRFIDEAVRSAIGQTYTDWELLIFDDGSTDDTESLIAPLLADKRIIYEKQENLGQPRTRNKGVRRSRGTLIAMLDADDVWHPEKLAKQVAIFDMYPEVGVCATRTRTIDGKSNVLDDSGWKEFHGRALPGLITEDVQIAMSSSVVRREVYDKIGLFDEGFPPFSMDFDFWLRAALEFDFHLIGETLTDYRVGHTSVSALGEKRRDIVLHTILPQFLNEYGGRKFVKRRDIRMFHARIYKARADKVPRWWTALAWYLRALAYGPCSLAIWRGAFGRLVPGLVRLFKGKKNEVVRSR